ncbi:cadherin-related [Schistosoma mansoni]|nr:cadherin-related [Schistosoma mansoni]|eukprot:XP_018655516.1 cadherin-related [Schistosoma mansoni]
MVLHMRMHSVLNISFFLMTMLTSAFRWWLLTL